MVSLNSEYLIFSISGSPFDDEIWLQDTKDSNVKSDGGRNSYIINIVNEKDFTHTITDDSETLGAIYLVGKTKNEEQYHTISNDDVVYNKETQTLVVFMRDRNKRHKHTGRIIFKRTNSTKEANVHQMQLYRVSSRGVEGCPQVSALHKAGMHCSRPERLDEEYRSREIGSNHRYLKYISTHEVFNSNQLIKKLL